MYTTITFKTIDGNEAHIAVKSSSVSEIIKEVRQAISWAKGGESFDILEIYGVNYTLLVEPSTIRFVSVSNPSKDMPKEESPW